MEPGEIHWRLRLCRSPQTNDRSAANVTQKHGEEDQAAERWRGPPYASALPKAVRAGLRVSRASRTCGWKLATSNALAFESLQGSAIPQKNNARTTVSKPMKVEVERF